jgi:DNA modification methylase
MTNETRDLTKHDILNPETAVVNVDSIYVGDRFRKDYGNMDELIADVAANGIISPLTVCTMSDEDRIRLNTTRDYRLVAGGRRINAARANNMPVIPVRIYPPGLDERRLRIIELAENEKRKGLEWQEQAKLTEAIHSSMVGLFGKKADKPGKAGADGWSGRDTAALMNRAVGAVSEDLKLAKAMTAVPELENCDTASQARQALKQAVRDIRAEEVADKFENGALDVEPLKKLLINAYVEGDFFKCCERIPDGSCNFVHMDPPYGIELDKARKSEQMIFTEEYTEWSREAYPTLMGKAIHEANRIMKSDSWLFIWHAGMWTDMLKDMCMQLSMVPCIVPLLWTKPNGQTNQPSLYLANAYEACLYVRKGKVKIIREGRVNHFLYPLVAKSISVHPTHKPVELIVDILTTFLPPGSHGCSPFLGSGTDILAACNSGMTCFGYDRSKVFKGKYIELVQKQELGMYTAYPHKKKSDEAPQPDLPLEFQGGTSADA